MNRHEGFLPAFESGTHERPSETFLDSITRRSYDNGNTLFSSRATSLTPPDILALDDYR